MTLVELMLGMSITVIISLAIVSVTAAVSNARARSEDTAQAIQAARASMTNLQRMIRSAKLVTLCTDTELVLWMNDTMDPGQINADEIVVLRYYANTRTVTRTRVEFPKTMADSARTAANVQVDLASILTVPQAITAMSNPQYRAERDIAVNVQSLKAVAQPAAPIARTVTLTAAFQAGQQTLMLTNAVTLRAPAGDQVDGSGGTYVLLTPLACANGGSTGRDNGNGY